MRPAPIAIALALLPACAPPPPAAPLDPFGLTSLKDYGAYRSSSNSPDPEDNDDSARPIAGETITLADLRGPGVVSHLWVTIAANEYGFSRLLRLRVYYDDSPTPSVDAPLGDFFAVGLGLERDVTSIMVRDGSSGRSRNSYWPMPFRKACRITLTNEGRRRTSNVYYHVDWHTVPSMAEDTPYFHARYRQALPAPAGKTYEILSTSGRGHYVGTVFNVVQAEVGWFGEGDERFYVDGEPKPRIEGTGTEDYFNDAWTLRVAHAPFTGVSVAQGTGVGSRMSAYRWHIPDPVPFTRALRLDIEHRGWTHKPDGSVRGGFEERADLMSSVAFWYQVGIAGDQPELPYGARRLPHGNARQIEVEARAAEVKVEKGKASVEKEVFWSKDILAFKAEGPGSSIEIPFDVPEDGRYELTTEAAHGPDYGDYAVFIDGKPAAAAGGLEHEPGANFGSGTLIRGHHTELYVAEEHLLAWLPLSRGRHTLRFVCVGKHPDSTGHVLGLDTLILARLGGLAPDSPRAVALRRGGPADVLARALATEPDPEARAAAAWSLGQMKAGAAPAVKELAAAMSDKDEVVRGLAAVALRDLGEAAKPALPALVAGLRDPSTAVRMMSANAIGAQRAVSAIDALIAACRVDDHVHVKRALAEALGLMGPAAAKALPELRAIREVPRSKWAAARAIRRIEGGGGK